MNFNCFQVIINKTKNFEKIKQNFAWKGYRQCSGYKGGVTSTEIVQRYQSCCVLNKFVRVSLDGESHTVTLTEDLQLLKLK
jgi:hypothetical protein